MPARRLGLTEDELEFLKELHLLTMKPVLYVANVSEEEVADASANPHVQAVIKYAAGEGAEVITYRRRWNRRSPNCRMKKRRNFWRWPD